MGCVYHNSSAAVTATSMAAMLMAAICRNSMTYLFTLNLVFIVTVYYKAKAQIYSAAVLFMLIDFSRTCLLVSVRAPLGVG